jgi:hypothetical protein
MSPLSFRSRGHADTGTVDPNTDSLPRAMAPVVWTRHVSRECSPSPVSPANLEHFRLLPRCVVTPLTIGRMPAPRNAFAPRQPRAQRYDGQGWRSAGQVMAKPPAVVFDQHQGTLLRKRFEARCPKEP